MPGTAAVGLRDAGLWQARTTIATSTREDWWFRTSFPSVAVDPDEQVLLCLDGIATVAEVYLNGELVLESESMFACPRSSMSARACEAENELTIRCRALGPLLRASPKAPRALAHAPRRRRKPALLSHDAAWSRTGLRARAGGRRPVALGTAGASAHGRPSRSSALRARLQGGDGVLSLAARLRTLGEAAVESAVLVLSREGSQVKVDIAPERTDGGLTLSGELVVPEVERWWPHTPWRAGALRRSPFDRRKRRPDRARSRAGWLSQPDARPGRRPRCPERRAGSADQRSLACSREVPCGPRSTPSARCPATDDLRRALEQVRDAGMNMLRIPGTAAYESETLFYELCDELGMLVWQDFMFANLDYPISEEPFRALVEQEVGQLLERLGGRPCLAVLCGNSEIEQQVAMLGLDPELGRGELFGELLPGLIAEHGLDAIYVPSAPCGGERPFRPDRGVANYYGVGGYRRPLSDARLAGVRFAAECLAFANVPDEDALGALLPDTSGRHRRSPPGLEGRRAA